MEYIYGVRVIFSEKSEWHPQWQYGNSLGMWFMSLCYICCTSPWFSCCLQGLLLQDNWHLHSHPLTVCICRVTVCLHLGPGSKGVLGCCIADDHIPFFMPFNLRAFWCCRYLQKQFFLIIFLLQVGVSLHNFQAQSIWSPLWAQKRLRARGIPRGRDRDDCIFYWN